MAASHSETYVLNAGVPQIVSIIKDARFIGLLKLTFKTELPLNNGGYLYQFTSGINMASWGENIDISILYINENSSQVIIKSECSMPTQIVDWGKNKENVSKIYQHLSGSIVYNQRIASNSAQYTVSKTFCSNCGARLNPTANFCTSCGMKKS